MAGEVIEAYEHKLADAAGTPLTFPASKFSGFDSNGLPIFTPVIGDGAQQILDADILLQGTAGKIFVETKYGDTTRLWTQLDKAKQALGANLIGEYRVVFQEGSVTAQALADYQRYIDSQGLTGKITFDFVKGFAP